MIIFLKFECIQETNGKLNHYSDSRWRAEIQNVHGSEDSFTLLDYCAPLGNYDFAGKVGQSS